MGRMLPLVTAISLSMATTLQAETLEMPTESAAPAATPAPAASSYTVTLPGRGMTMTQVEEKFGPPLQKMPEVGDPPIIRWIYPNYTVYFEYQFVINSIMNATAGAPLPASMVEVPAETEMPADVDIPAEAEMPLEETMMPEAEEAELPTEIPSPFEGVEIIGEPEEAMPAETVTEEDAPIPVLDEEGEIVIIEESPANP